MVERRRLGDRHITVHSALPSLVRKKLSWPVIGVALVLMIAPAVTVHFFERISYQNELNQYQVQAGKVRDQANQQKADLKHIIGNSSTQLNCLQLQSDAAKQLCEEHNAAAPL